ncbi:MAG TPA: alpha-ketoacid dehydrogenase subunit beta [Deltaproteobacteria bacterium]|nr:alpha-ketoacid dehydrogenase subunit beta [Deltaproteobacteria bacterium]
MPWTKVFSNREEFEREFGPSGDGKLRAVTYREAINETTASLLASDESVFVLGEGVDDPGGVFGTIRGLAGRFGGERVMDTPLAENGITGVAVGAAVAGMRPILVHMRMDFLPLAMDQLINHAAKWRYMFGGAVNVPLVVRGIIGRGWGSAAQHSQSLHPLFAHVPGLKVVMPATPYDGSGLLRAAVYDGNPVVFIEHRWLFEHIGHVPAEPFEVEIGKGIVRRRGSDVTIVAFSYMVYEALRAAKTLEAEGIEAEVVDPRTLRPLDEEIIIDSVRKTGRLVTAEPGWRLCGMGSEVAALAAEKAFHALKAPPVRINTADVPTPASHVLEEAFYPGADDIAGAARRIVRE